MLVVDLPADSLPYLERVMPTSPRLQSAAAPWFWSHRSAVVRCDRGAERSSEFETRLVQIPSAC